MGEKDLHDYQKACVQHIIDNKFCGVFLEMGLGKTVSTLTAIEHLMNDYLEVSKVLVISPKRVTESVWKEEAEKWDHLKHLRFSKIIGNEESRIRAIRTPADIYLVSRDNIAWLCAYFGGCSLPYDMIVVDELSSFKSYKSQRFKALKICQPTFKRFVGLTGTPAPNSMIDLWPQIYLMDRGERLGKTITSFRQNFFSPGKSNGHIVYSYNLLSGADATINERIGDICISMKADDYLKMPERTDNFIKLTLPPDIKKKYKEFEKEKILSLVSRDGEEKEIAVTSAVALSNKLLQFANGNMYDVFKDPDTGEEISKDVHHIHDVKLDALEEIVESQNGKPVLIAWSFVFDKASIMQRLKKYKPRELKTPQDIIDWNNGKVQVMLAHPASAGHGLNLQAGGSTIIWFGLTWSLELYQQFNARLYRQGQRDHVVINHLICEGTHDEDTVRAIKNKDKSQKALMDSIKAKIENYISNGN